MSQTQNKPTLAQRKAQSARDKALNTQIQKKGGKGASFPLMSGSRMEKFIRPVFAMTPPRPQKQKQPNNFPRVANRDRQALLTEDISFDEYIGEVPGSVGFAAVKYAHQPGIVGTFPKGSVKAALYSEWKQVRCEYYYKPEVSGFATQGQTGKVILALDYNAGNPAPTTKQQVEIMHRVDDMPYEKMSLVTDTSCVNRSDSKYIRTGPVPIDEDIKTFDGGNLWVCTYGQTNTTVVGELHVRYTFRCSKPTLLNPVQGGLIPNVTVGSFQSSAAEAGAYGVATKLLAATAISNGVGIVNTSGSFVPPAGNYLLDVAINWSASAASDTQTAVFDVKKNAVSVFPAGTLPVMLVSETLNAGESQLTGGGASTTLFVTANGTDAFTVPIIITGAAATLTQWGTIRFVAV